VVPNGPPPSVAPEVVTWPSFSTSVVPVPDPLLPIYIQELAALSVPPLTVNVPLPLMPLLPALT
jgi:hypothetical protein